MQADVHPEDLEAVVTGITIHELDHILDRPALYRERRDAEPDRLKFEALVLADEVGQPRPTVAPPPYSGHGASFSRIALHLRHRAREHGVLLLANALCAGPRYGLSPASAYRASLGDEPVRLFADRLGQNRCPVTCITHVRTSPYYPPVQRQTRTLARQSQTRMHPTNMPRFTR